MSKMKWDRMDVCLLDAIRIRSWYKDFDGDINKWKMAFYELWRYQLTFDFAFDIEVRETRKEGVYVSLSVNPSYADVLINTMTDLGFNEITTESETVAEISGYDFEDCVDPAVIGW